MATKAEGADDRKLVGFRADEKTKQQLEDLARASGFTTLQDFMAAVANLLLEDIDPDVLRTMNEMRERRGQPRLPKVKAPKKAESGRVAQKPVQS